MREPSSAMPSFPTLSFQKAERRGWGTVAPWLLPCGDLLAQALFLFPEFRSELGAEVVGFEHLANFDLRPTVEGTALEPLDRLFHRPYLPQPEAGDQLLGLGERPVSHGLLPSRELDALAFRAGVKPLACEHHAGFHQLFVVLPHCRQDLLGRHNARL